MMESTPVATPRTILPERNLDLLRAMAVMLVVFDHLFEGMDNHANFFKWAGQAGVQAFFVHTALVLMASLERDGAPDRAGWIRRFYVRRAFRIYPLAWAIITMMIVFKMGGGLWADWQPLSFLQVAANYGLVMDLAGVGQVLPVMWSLPLEMEMYVVLPFCYLVARRKRGDGVALLYVAGLALATLFIVGIQPSSRLTGMWRFQVFQFIPCFMMGVIAYWMLRRRMASPWKQLPSWTWILFILADVIGLSRAWFTIQPHWVTRALFCAFIGLLIPFVAEAAPSIFTRAANRIATYSYGIYLIHPLALRLGYRGMKGQPLALQLLAASAVLVVGCYVAYHYVEKPGIKLGQRLAGGRLGAPLPLESTAAAP